MNTNTPTQAQHNQASAVPADPIADLADVYARAKTVLVPADWQSLGKGKGFFLTLPGCDKLARAFGLSVMCVSNMPARDENGVQIGAQAIYRATDLNGRFIDAEGSAERAEIKGDKAVENSITTRAGTRAKKRAILALLAFDDSDGPNAIIPPHLASSPTAAHLASSPTEDPRRNEIKKELLEVAAQWADTTNQPETDSSVQTLRDFLTYKNYGMPDPDTTLKELEVLLSACKREALRDI